jgi:hypothetical protein
MVCYRTGNARAKFSEENRATFQLDAAGFCFTHRLAAYDSTP